MRATTAVSTVWRAYALAFGLGLAFLGMGVGLAHSQSAGASGPTQIVQPQVPDHSFVCHAQPGGWCDLRDWTGFGQATAN